MNFEQAKEKIEKYGQEHLLRFYDELSESEKESLLNQIEEIDFELMQSLFEKKKCL